MGVVAGVDIWRVASLRPGLTPLTTLAQHLFHGSQDIPPEEAGREPALPVLAEGDYDTPAALAALFDGPAEPAVKPILKALARIEAELAHGEGFGRKAEARLLLVVDQLDELFGPSVNPDERARFAALLAALARSGRVVVIATLRADLTASFLREPALRALKSDGAELVLAPPGPAEMTAIVREPARAAGLVFETNAAGESLDDRLLRDADKPDMLPLLQLALAKLFAGAVKRDGELVLPFAAYAGSDGAGGLANLIDAEGERALTACLGGAEQAALPRLMRLLVETDKAGAPSLVAVKHEALPSDPATGRLIAGLVDARIAISDATGLRIAHQRVLTDWSRAARIIADNTNFYRQRDDVDDAFRRWMAGGKDKARLIQKGAPLAEAEALVKAFGAELRPEAVAFVQQSGRRARFWTRATQAAAMVFAGVAAVAVWQWRAAEEQTRLARAAEVRAEQERDSAQRSYRLARDTVNDVVFEFAQGFKQTEGIRGDVIDRVLGRAKAALDRLVSAAPDDLALQRLRLAQLLEFGDVRLRAGDGPGALAAYEEGLVIARRLAAADAGNAVSQADLVVSLYRLKSASTERFVQVASMCEAATILRSMADRNLLSADQKSWPALFASELQQLNAVCPP
jgi:eukaryotic-like serine/threonine-protein kinase